MESLVFLGFVGILRDALKIFTKNGRITASIALFILITKSTLFVSNVISIIPFISDFMIEKNLLNFTTPNTPEFNNILTHIRKDIKIVFGLECFYIILYLAAYLLSTTATILAAAIIHGGNENLSLKDLVSRTVKALKRPFLTSLYVSLLGLIYLFVFFFIIFSVVLIIQNRAVSIFAAIFLSAIAILIFLYINVSWTLAIVISTVEEAGAFEAVSKASKIVKGMELQGFLLNIFLNIISIIMLRGMNLIPKAYDSVALAIIVPLVQVNCSGLLIMYWLTAFTVLYYRCKKTHGEKVELLESLDGYTKIPTTSAAATTAPPVIAENIP